MSRWRLNQQSISSKNDHVTGNWFETVPLTILTKTYNIPELPELKMYKQNEKVLFVKRRCKRRQLYYIGWLSIKDTIFPQLLIFISDLLLIKYKKIYKNLTKIIPMLSQE